MTVSANEVGVSLYWLGRVVVSSTAVPMSLLPRAGLGVGSAYFSIVGNVGIYGGGKVCAYHCYSNASPSESMPDPSPVCVAGTRVVTAAAPACRLLYVYRAVLLAVFSKRCSANPQNYLGHDKRWAHNLM